jgi:hypothetical protein
VYVIACANPTLRLRLPSCAKIITAATLSRPDHPLITLTPPTQTVPGDVALTGIPDDAPRGVYTLALTSDCGCYSTLVYLNVCPPIAFVPTHTPTGATQQSIECCEPDTQPDWDTIPVVAAFHVTQPTPGTYLLTLDPPVPEGLALSYSVLTDTLTVTLASPAPADPQDIYLIDSSGIILATGQSPDLTLTFDLRCASYWLQIGATPPAVP